MTNQIPVVEISHWILVLFWFGCFMVGTAVGSFLIDLKWIFKTRRKKNEE